MNHARVRTRVLARRPEAGILLLRLFFAAILIYGTLDNVLSEARMHEFRDFLAHHGFPYPLFSARLSVYAQFVCGLLLLAGFATRLAALVMIVNFVVALGMVHVGLEFGANIAPLSMLALAVFFALHGGGRFAMDATRAGTSSSGSWWSRVGPSSPSGP
jgi:putative oxidoreductase